MRFRHFLCAAFVFPFAAQFAPAQKNLPAPAWKSGELLFYRVHLKIDRDIKTKSALALPQSPTDAKMDISGILQVKVLSPANQTSAGHIRLRTWFLSLDSGIGALPRGAKPGQFDGGIAPGDDKFIDCTLAPGGQLGEIEGLEKLEPEQQTAWREWAARFSAPFTLEREKRKRGEKWNSEEPETTTSPIADLRWQKKSQYVRDEPCAPLKFSGTEGFQRSAASESCAVILSTASLLQKSSRQDATPQDYKLRGLHTQGTAKGTNEVILYISRKTGRLIRATQDVTQQMDVLIALSTAGNQVHYGIQAKANSTVELVTDLSPVPRAKLSK